MQTPKPKKPTFRFSIYWMYAVILLFLVGMLYLDDNSVSKEVNYTQFCNIVEHGGVKSITVLSSRKEAKAVLSDSIAQQQFKTFTPGEGHEAYVITTIPDVGKFDEKTEAWRQQGVFT